MPTYYKWEKIIKTGPHIKSLPQTSLMLNYLNCELVLTANNHFKDYGWEGMYETYEALKKYQINWIGSGENIKEASKPFFIEKNGFKISIINMAENEWSTTNGELPGCNPIDYPTALLKIQEAKLQGF